MKYALLSLILFASTLFFVDAGFGQPGGCYPGTWQTENCREKREQLIRGYRNKIDDLNSRIAREPRNAELFFQRGSVYSSMIFGSGLGTTKVEFDDVVYFDDIDAKAMQDFATAIELTPRAQYFLERGRLYEELWQRQERMKPSIIFQSDARQDERLHEINALYFDNANFRAADSDYKNAVAMSADDMLKENAETYSILIRYRRSLELGLGWVTSQVLAGTRYADLMMADFDRYVDHAKKLEPKHNFGMFDVKSALSQRSEVAAALGKDDAAIRSLNEVVPMLKAEDGYFCKIFSLRAKVLARNRKVDDAIKDLTTVVSAGQSCKWLFESRGDLYKQKGDLSKALTDYTQVVNLEKPYLTSIQFWKRGKLYYQLGEVEKALADYSRAIGSFSDCEEDFLLRAQAHRRLGNEMAAQDDLNTADKLASRPIAERESSCAKHRPD